METCRAGVPGTVPTGTLLVRDVNRLYTGSATLGEIEDAAIFVRGNVIEWVGSTSELPAQFSTADETISLSGHIMLPGRSTTAVVSCIDIFPC